MVYPTVFFLIFPALVVGLIVMTVMFYQKDKKKAEAEAIVSEEYKQKIAEAEQDAANRQKTLDEQYEKMMKEYNKQLAEYNKGEDAWRMRRDSRLNLAKSELQNALDQLNALYARSPFIPVNCRRSQELRYLYNVMNANSCNVPQAIRIAQEAERRRQEEEYILEMERSEQRARRREMAGNFLSTAAGVYVGTRAANKKAEREKPREKSVFAMCPLGCPHRRKNGSSCGADPKLCGFGRVTRY